MLLAVSYCKIRTPAARKAPEAGALVTSSQLQADDTGKTWDSSSLADGLRQQLAPAASRGPDNAALYLPAVVVPAGHKT